jgi:hypothetical protein
MDYTLAEAIDRTGAEWIAVLPQVAKQISDERAAAEEEGAALAR